MKSSIVAGAVASILAIALCLFTLLMQSVLSHSNIKAKEAAEARPRRVEAKAALWGPCSDEQRQAKWRPLGPQCLRQSLMYIKIPKTGSSTVMGVMRRIAARHGLDGVDRQVKSSKDVQWEPFCAADHEKAAMKLKRFRLHTLPLMLITFVRDPIQRAISGYFYFGHQGLQRTPASMTAEDTIEYLKTTNLKKSIGRIETSYIMYGNNSKLHFLDAILAGYRFIGVTERMDESMVALKHMLNLPSLCDVLYTSRKNSSSTKNSHESVKQNPKIQALRQSDSFRSMFQPDLLLHAAANKTLDRLIAKIGKASFEAELSDFRRMLEEVTVRCTGKHDRHCYWNDEGCYYDCMDQVCSSQR